MMITKNIDVKIVKYRIKRIRDKNIIVAYIKSENNKNNSNILI